MADTWNGRVAVFNSEGRCLASWPVQAWASTSLDNKPHLAIGPAGEVFVTDPEGFRVLGFTPDGQARTAFGQSGAEQEALGLPTGIAAGVNGDPWIADAGNNRLVRYVLPTPPAS